LEVGQGVQGRPARRRCNPHAKVGQKHLCHKLANLARREPGLGMMGYGADNSQGSEEIVDCDGKV